MRRLPTHVKSDERILGDSDFVQSVLSHQNEQLEARYLLKAQGYDFGYALARVVQLSGVEAEHILRASKQPVRLYARSLLCHWAIHSLGMTAAAVSKLPGITPSAVTGAAYRGDPVPQPGPRQPAVAMSGADRQTPPRLTPSPSWC
jgi:hypothetical protein